MIFNKTRKIVHLVGCTIDVHLLVNKRTLQFFESATLELIKGKILDISFTVLLQRVACRVASVVMEVSEISING